MNSTSESTQTEIILDCISRSQLVELKERYSIYAKHVSKSIDGKRPAV